MSTDQVKTQPAETPTNVTAAGAAENMVPKQAKSIRSRLDDGSGPIHNFDGDKQAQWKLTALATGGSCKEGSAMDGEIIDLKYYYCHTVQMVSQKTGDIIDAMRCVLISKDGTAWRFVSGTVIDALDNLRSIFGDGPYTDPVKFTIEPLKSRTGNQIYNLVPHSDE